jgi:hypothetical protein
VDKTETREKVNISKKRERTRGIKTPPAPKCYLITLVLVAAKKQAGDSYYYYFYYYYYCNQLY